MDKTNDEAHTDNEKLSLTVKSSTKKEVIEVSEDSSISNFKQLIADKFKVDGQSFKLIYAGRILKDTDTIKSLSIKTGYTIYLVLKQISQATNSSPNNDASSTNLGLESRLSENLLRHYANTPDIIRSVLNNNPALQQIIQTNPEIGHIINNPTLLREAMEVMRNPNVANEFVRSADRAMSNIESLPGGFNALQQMYHDIEEPLLNATNNSTNPFASLFTSASSHQQGSENREPLPNPWSSNQSGNNEIDIDNLTISPSVQNIVQQLHAQVSQSGNAPDFQTLQDIEAILFNMPTAPTEDAANMHQQLNDLIAQNANEQTGNTNFSPEVFENVMLPALLLANMLRNQPPDSSNNNTANLNVTQLLSQLNLQNEANNPAQLEEHYRPQMQQLTEMGFINQETNLQALIACFGDVNRAIEMLLSRNFG